MEKTATPWVLTRARDESRALQSALREAGVPSLVMPCIERKASRFPAWPWPVDAARPRFLFLTSPYAVGCVPWRRVMEAGVRVAALSPRCVQAVEEQGGRVELKAAGGTVALAKALAAHVARRFPSAQLDVVYPTSTLGPDLPEQKASRAVLSRLGRLSVPVVYATVVPRALTAQVQRLDGRAVSLVFASPSAVEHFQAARKASGARPRVTRVVCLGRSTARGWNASKWSSWPKAEVVATAAQLLAVLTKERKP